MKKIILVITVLLVSGCIQSTGPHVDMICENLCKNYEGDLSDGPCLSNNLIGDSDWVCDVAHSPRQDVDNLPENQCETYRNGTATHFVEVDENCNLIRAH